MLTSLHVDKFRAMDELSIPLGAKITAIAGQNATCKSTLLGMIGQPFGLKHEKTIFGRSFSTKFSDIFKWSTTYDIPGTHRYSVKLNDPQLSSEDAGHVESYVRPKEDASHIRLVVGSKERRQGNGNIDYPVIYLGLKRLYPIGELVSIAQSPPTLTPDEMVSFEEWYKKVFIPLESISPIQITSKKTKDTLAVNADYYDYYANSAGQDNLGQILGAILSFQRLADKQGSSYHGGLLLIDEIDATLFPAAQVGLVDLFYKLAGKMKLQFIFTTQSIELLDHISRRRGNDGEAKILYFDRAHGPLKLQVDPSMDWVRSNLEISTLDAKNTPKLNVYCEDAEGSWFAKRLLGPRKTKLLKFMRATFGGEHLNKLATMNLPEFNNSIIILDGDKAVGKHTPRNVLCLPGGDSPERVLRKLLLGLPADSEFWNGANGYNWQVFRKNLSDLTNGQTDRTSMKNWFKAEKKYWGPSAGKRYKYWLKAHSDKAAEFSKAFVTAYSDVGRRKSIPPLE
jgi:hypothetical protein